MKSVTGVAILFTFALALASEEKGEYDALVELFKTTNGPNWGNNTGWLTNNEYCTWAGVNCNSGSLVIELELGSNNLTGAIPDSLGQLTQLQYLRLFYNQLTGAIPDSLGQLSQLQDLDLTDNQLTGEIPDSLGQLSQLQTLQLSYNKITGALPASLGQLLLLQMLDIRNNKLTGELPDSLGQLSQLQVLYLYGNQLTGIPASMQKPPALQGCKLGSNNFACPIPSWATTNCEAQCQ